MGLDIGEGRGPSWGLLGPDDCSLWMPGKECLLFSLALRFICPILLYEILSSLFDTVISISWCVLVI